MKITRTGRSKGDGRFVQLHHWMMRSPAWRDLTPAERAIYLEIATLYNGENNGSLGLGARRAADLCNISKNTAPAAFQRLQDLGFIECATPGGFSKKTRHQTEWRLTAYRCNLTQQPGSRAFMKWRPGEKSRSQMRDATVPNEGQSHPKQRPTVPEMVPSRQRGAA